MSERNESTGIGEENLPQLQDHPAQRRRARDLHGPAPQAAPGLSRGYSTPHSTGLRPWHVLQASTFRTTSMPSSRCRRSTASARRARRRSARRPASRRRPRSRTCPTRDGQAARAGRQVHGRGRPAPRGDDEHQAADGPRLLPRLAPPQGPAGPRPAHPHQRPHPQGPEEGPHRRARQGRDRSNRGSTDGTATVPEGTPRRARARRSRRT